MQLYHNPETPVPTEPRDMFSQICKPFANAVHMNLPASGRNILGVHKLPSTQLTGS